MMDVKVRRPVASRAATMGDGDEVRRGIGEDESDGDGHRDCLEEQEHGECAPRLPGQRKRDEPDERDESAQSDKQTRAVDIRSLQDDGPAANRPIKAAATGIGEARREYCEEKAQRRHPRERQQMTASGHASVPEGDALHQDG